MMDQERNNSVGILITTSLNPPHFLRRASKVLAFSLPNSKKINRGSLSLKYLFSYCWNLKISRLLILQKAKSDNTAMIKAYSIDEKVEKINLIIELSDIISLRKHDKNTRIVIDRVQLEFFDNRELLMKSSMLNLFKPILEIKTIPEGSKTLTIMIKPESSTSIIGTAIQKGTKGNLSLYTLKIRKDDENGRES